MSSSLNHSQSTHWRYDWLHCPPLYVFVCWKQKSQRSSLPVNIRFVSPPPGWSARRLNGPFGGEIFFFSCVTHFTAALLWYVHYCHLTIFESWSQSVSFVSPRICIPDLWKPCSGWLVRSLDMIILVTPIWKTFVCTLAHTYEHTLAGVKTRRRRRRMHTHTCRRLCTHTHRMGLQACMHRACTHTEIRCIFVLICLCCEAETWKQEELLIINYMY